MVRVAINGFGRIGRLVFRAGADDPDIEFVAINDLTGSDNLAYLLKYDSVHGIFRGDVRADGSNLLVDGKKINVSSEKDPSMLPWKKFKVDVVVESTGIFRKRSECGMHIKAGAKKVILSAPGKGDEPIKTIVIGVNEDEIKKDDLILSNASCTTNSIAPVAKVLNDNFGIKRGFLTTVHSYTADQHLVDAPHKDWRRGRNAASNIVPTTTGAAKAVGEVIPELDGKLDGRAIRVPTPDGSITDFTVELEKEATIEDIKKLFRSAAKKELKGIIEYTEDEIVSSDIVGNPHSGIVDGKLMQLIDGRMLKIFSWYDNEFGYSKRMIDMVNIMAGK